jgi:hypothetical protein
MRKHLVIEPFPLVILVASVSDEKFTLDTTRKNDRNVSTSNRHDRHYVGSVRGNLVRVRRSVMSFVPYSKEFATLEDKHKIRKMLEYSGINHPAQQIVFLTDLLGKPFDTTKLSKQEAIDIKRKIKNLQEKDKG